MGLKPENPPFWFTILGGFGSDISRTFDLSFFFFGYCDFLLSDFLDERYTL